MVSGNFACRIGTQNTEANDWNARIGKASALTDYLHGPPAAAPTGLMPMTPGQTPAGSSGMQCDRGREL